MIAFALMLAAASAAACLVATEIPATARNHVRFACGLYGSLAVASAVDVRLADAVVLVVSPVAPASLMLAAASRFHKPVATVFASAILAVAALGGILGAMTGLASLSFAPLALAVIATIAICLDRIRERHAAAVRCILASSAILAGASAFAEGGKGGMAALIAFTSAGLLGVTLSIRRLSDGIVDQQRGRDPRGAAIGHPR